MKRLEAMDHFLEYMDEKSLLESIVRAMDEDEARENFEYIARMHEVPFNEEEE